MWEQVDWNLYNTIGDLNINKIVYKAKELSDLREIFNANFSSAYEHGFLIWMGDSDKKFLLDTVTF